MQTISTTDLAHRLRPVIARLARRMRQEAGGELSPTQGAALSTIACHGPLTPSELAARERIQRPTATRVLAPPGGGGADRSAPPIPRTGRSSLVASTPAGHALLAVRARAQGRLSGSAADGLSPEDLAALDRAAGDPRAGARGGRRVSRRRSRAPSPRSASRTTAVLHRPGGLDHRQLDADRRRDVADGQADRLRRRGRADRRRCSSCRSCCSAPGAACWPTGSPSGGC